MDIALQNFDVHAFRAAFQMVIIIISKQMLCQPFHTLVFYSKLYVWSFILAFNIVLKKGPGLTDEYVFFCYFFWMMSMCSCLPSCIVSAAHSCK